MNGTIIILGSPNDERGNLSETAKGRLVQGLVEYRRQTDFKILCTGGFGKHFNTTNKPHAEYAIRYLIQEGVLKNDILEIAKSQNTVEDALLSRRIIEKYKARSLIVVSSDFHMERVMHIFKRVFKGYDLTFSGAKTSFSRKQYRAVRDHEKKELEKLRKKGIPGLHA